MRWILLASLVAAAGCQLDPPPPLDDDAGGDDAPDASLDCAPDTITCEDGRYIDCGSNGVPEVTMACPLGCDSVEPKCLDIDPSNGVARYLDQTRTDDSVRDVILGEGSRIDTDSGVVFDGAADLAIPSIDIGDYRVFMMKSLMITGATKVSGVDGIIIVSDGNVAITARLDLSGDLQVPGPGANLGACAGGDTSAVVYGGGGGGGGNAEAGAEGGRSDGNAAPSGLAGAALLDADLDPLRGGCDGGSAVDTDDTCQSHGGGGGGALQVVSRTEIALTSAGIVDASGGGGRGAHVGIDGCTSTGARGGAGGGSGGSVLLEAPVVRLAGPTVVIATNGGGGSAGGIGNIDGADGGIAATPAVGGFNGLTAISGGDGGTDAVAPERGMDGDPNEYGGGGGGSVGRTRFNTRTGMIDQTDGAALRTRFTASIVRTRLVP